MIPPVLQTKNLRFRKVDDLFDDARLLRGRVGILS